MARSIPLLVLSMILIMGCSSRKIEAHKVKTMNGDPKRYNVIDGCWRNNAKWAVKPQTLADCAKGYGAEAQGGKNGDLYVVTDPSDDPINPKTGTLRYGVIQKDPLWITFQKDMNITLVKELVVNSYKTIDGRGAKVKIGDGPCIMIQKASHVIVHGLTFENCRRGKGSDGDGIRLLQATNVWIDHCHLSRCDDGLIDVTLASTFVTISNNQLSSHRKVMLLGHSDNFPKDQDMKVTVVFNHFGPQLVSRIPRARFGSIHVANNRYEKWLLYAIGGSKHPTILSEGNYFTAPDNPSAKEVTWRKIKKDPDWENWSWTSKKDSFLNGAYFNESGKPWQPSYSGPQQFVAASGNEVLELTQDAGPLQCDRVKAC